jgi:hypothetical protein
VVVAVGLVVHHLAELQAQKQSKVQSVSTSDAKTVNSMHTSSGRTAGAGQELGNADNTSDVTCINSMHTVIQRLLLSSFIIWQNCRRRSRAKYRAVSATDEIYQQHAYIIWCN